MVKKQVPDWLNSSLWSTNPPPPPPPPRHPSPPPAIKPPEPVKVEITDPLRDAVSSTSADHDYSATPSPTSSTLEDVSKQALLLQEISNKLISLSELRRLASQGIPDGAGVRSTVWKLLLGYLPNDRGLWPSELAKKRSQYKNFKDELLMNPSEIARMKDNSISVDYDEPRSEGKGLLSRSQITHDEHPLSLGTTSAWNKFFQDTEIIEQIDRDVMRTHPDLHFFSGDTPFAKSNQEALRSILIIFAKLNPGIRYVQGMNEVLAPLFYVFRNDPIEENASSAEADTFFCFVELISGFRDNFCQQLDNSMVGIRSTIAKLSQLLKEHDEELWRHLEVTTKLGHMARVKRTRRKQVTRPAGLPVDIIAAIAEETLHKHELHKISSDQSIKNLESLPVEPDATEYALEETKSNSNESLFTWWPLNWCTVFSRFMKWLTWS